MTAPNLRGEPAADLLATKLFEPSGPSQSAVSWSFPAAARPPRQLRASFWLWLIAVAAGLFETTLVVVDATAGEVGSVAEVAVGVMSGCWPSPAWSTWPYACARAGTGLVSPWRCCMAGSGPCRW
jgi:hypothetical protein